MLIRIPQFMLLLTCISVSTFLISGCTESETPTHEESTTEEATTDDPETAEATDEDKHYAVTGTPDNFDELKNSGKPVLVDYWAVWCGPCMLISPKIEELAKKLDGKAVIIKVNVDEQPSLVPDDIEGYPFFAFYKDGEKVDQVLGLPSLDLDEAARALEDKLLALADDGSASE
ncbi:MAG: hypothetical protein Fues2KO_14920 [Fuerstiella sp.]